MSIDADANSILNVSLAMASEELDSSFVAASTPSRLSMDNKLWLVHVDEILITRTDRQDTHRRMLIVAIIATATDLQHEATIFFFVSRSWSVQASD